MLSKKLAIDHIPQLIRGKRILIRADFNVPVKGGKVTDPTRIESTIPTIKYCLDNGAKSIILMSHLGRPDGQRNDKYTLNPVIPALEDYMQKKVQFMNDCVGRDVEEACIGSDNGKILLLENLRFHMEEEGKGVVNGEKVKASKENIDKFK